MFHSKNQYCTKNHEGCKLNEQRYLTETNIEVDISELSYDNFKAAMLKCFNKKLWSGQDRGIGRHASPLQATIERITTTSQTN